MIKKECEKILNCKSPTIERGRTRNVKTKVIPVMTETTGTISKSFRKYLSNITVKHDNKLLQKSAILGTVHVKIQSIHHGRTVLFWVIM